MLSSLVLYILLTLCVCVCSPVAQVDCVVEAIAVNHQTIMCSAACNSTNEINISTSLLPSTSVNCQDVASSIATVKG